MKIEFCCEEMAKRYWQSIGEMNFYWYATEPSGDGIGLTYLQDNYGEELYACPYCGAKIEITVKDK